MTPAIALSPTIVAGHAKSVPDVPVRTPVESSAQAPQPILLGRHCDPDYLSGSFKRQVGWSPLATRCITAIGPCHHLLIPNAAYHTSMTNQHRRF